MTRYLIIDDEPIAHRIIERYCDDIPHLQKVGNCFNAFQAMQFLNEEVVDLIFLDLNMPKLTGFEFLETLINPPKVIVTTAYQEFALKGYELNISDYLLKPFSFARFLKAVNKTIEVKLVSPESVNLPPADQQHKSTHFFIKGNKKHHQINPDDILYIEAAGNYSKLFLTDEMIVCHEKISSLEDKLSAGGLLRVHKSFLVAVNKINQIEGNRIHINGSIIPVGQTYKNVINQLLA